MIKSTLKDMEKAIGKLVESAKERNTKREIKEVAGQLKRLVTKVTSEEVTQLMRRIEEGQDIQSGIPVEDISAKQRFQIKEAEAKLIYKEIGCQTEVEGVISTGIINVGDVRSYEDFIKVEHLEWPNNLYKRAFTVSGSPVMAGKDTDLIYLEEKGGRGKRTTASEERCWKDSRILSTWTEIWLH